MKQILLKNAFNKTSKTFMLILLLVFLLKITQQADANSDSSFKELTNLQKLAEQSQQLKLPIMLMFGAEWCEFCELLQESVFDPMMLGGLYEEKVVLMRHVGVDEAEPIPSWDGTLINKAKWAYELDADLTPTVLFFDANGHEVAPRIIGISEITLYAGLIHQRLNTAYKNMGLTKRIPVTPELLEKESVKKTQ
ncbi:thioredoxin family protein [Thiomicrorhabdus sp.]|uniref:thioredoxin family protein n=1 Tax=Thiomicrorhabdus sp. TaxID=2039724 RepID=UPI002AA69885|nr:thioredoxin fold domain-containing protein [Thiomicrorhabdus sp.]